MSSNVGLSTPRGSGTSGYVQRNLSLLKPRDAGVGVPYTLNSGDRDRGPKTRKPDQAILLHDRLREVEVRVLEERERLEELQEREKEGDGEEEGKGEGEGEEDRLTEEEIESRCDALRQKLIAELERERNGNSNNTNKAQEKGKGLKRYQVHELAEAKERESERLRRALGLKGDEVGEEHPMARQEKRRRGREEEELRREEARIGGERRGEGEK